MKLSGVERGCGSRYMHVVRILCTWNLDRDEAAYLRIRQGELEARPLPRGYQAHPEAIPHSDFPTSGGQIPAS